MRSILLSVMIILLVTVLIGCSEKQCPEPIYPKLEAIDKIPHYDFYVMHGTLDQNSTMRAFKTIKALRVSEHYYFTLISDYRREFIK